jgi:hypothetical protein
MLRKRMLFLPRCILVFTCYCAAPSLSRGGKGSLIHRQGNSISGRRDLADTLADLKAIIPHPSGLSGRRQGSTYKLLSRKESENEITTGPNPVSVLLSNGALLLKYQINSPNPLSILNRLSIRHQLSQ